MNWKIYDRVFRITHKTWVPNFFRGIGLGWATSNENYYQYPIALFFPEIYCGYHIFNERTSIMKNWNLNKEGS